MFGLVGRKKGAGRLRASENVMANRDPAFGFVNQTSLQGHYKPFV
jgi:hypothetical protein